MSATYDPKATFGYVKQLQSLPPPTTIETRIRDDSSHTFSAPLFYSEHHLGGSDSSTAAGRLYMGPARDDVGTKLGQLPPLAAFDEPSVLRSSFERDFPRPLVTRKGSSAIQRPLSSEGAELRCDKITAIAMGSFLAALGCTTADCVTANDYAVRLGEALRLQYNLDAELSTAKVTGNVKYNSSRSHVLRRLLMKDDGTGVVGGGDSGSTSSASWPPDAVQTVDELKRKVRGLAFDLDTMRLKYDGRIKQLDLRKAQRCVGAIRESAKEMAKEVSFIRDDIRDAFVEFSREFNELPCVKDLKHAQPKLRQFEASAAALMGASANAGGPPPDAPAISAAALLRLAAKLPVAAAQYAGDVCNVDMPSDTVKATDLSAKVANALGNVMGLSAADVATLATHDGSEKATTRNAVRAAYWALQMADAVGVSQAEAVELRRKLTTLEQEKAALMTAAADEAGRRSPPSSPSAGRRGAGDGRGGVLSPKASFASPPPLQQSVSSIKKGVATPAAAKTAVGNGVAVPATSKVPTPSKAKAVPSPAAAPSTATTRRRPPNLSHDDDDGDTEAVHAPPPAKAVDAAPLAAMESLVAVAAAANPLHDAAMPVVDAAMAKDASSPPVLAAASAAPMPPPLQGTVAAAEDKATALALAAPSPAAEGPANYSDETTTPYPRHPQRSRGVDVADPTAAILATIHDSGLTPDHSIAELLRALSGDAAEQPVRTSASLTSATLQRVPDGGGAVTRPQATNATPQRNKAISNAATPSSATPPTLTAPDGARTADARGDRASASPAAAGAARSALNAKAANPVPNGGGVASSKPPAAAVPDAKQTMQQPPAASKRSSDAHAARDEEGRERSVTSAGDGVKAADAAASGVAPWSQTNPTSSLKRVQSTTTTTAILKRDARSEAPPLQSSPIPIDTSFDNCSMVSMPAAALEDTPHLPPAPAVAAVPGVAAAAILKFRFSSTAASPNLSKAAGVSRTVAHASDGDRLERMRRAMEGGALQQRRFHIAHQLLFDGAVDVATPELTADERALHRLGGRDA